jgi:hypothetical protein
MQTIGHSQSRLTNGHACIQFSLDGIAHGSTIGLGEIPFDGSLGCRFSFWRPPGTQGHLLFELKAQQTLDFALFWCNCKPFRINT